MPIPKKKSAKGARKDPKFQEKTLELRLIMPTYEYFCKHCEAIAEVLQKMSDAPLKTCPHCGQDSLRRKISGGIGFSLKSPTHDGTYTHCACGKKSHCGS